jgi:DNA-binding IclR family transcriptional regulator
LAAEPTTGAAQGATGSLQHGLAILSMFTETASVISVSAMSRQLGVHRSTASRLAATLSASGFLSPTADPGKYRLGTRLVRLGGLAAHGLDPRSIGTAALTAAVEKLGETAHLGVREGREAVTVAIVDGWRTIRMHSWAGKRSPAYCSSLGKALLAGLSDEELERVYPPGERDFESRTARTVTGFDALRADLAQTRARGYTLDDEELETGLRCVGAPVFDRFGIVIASVSMSGPAERVKGEYFESMVATIRFAAFSASTDLGCPPDTAYWGPDTPAAALPPGENP